MSLRLEQNPFGAAVVVRGMRSERAAVNLTRSDVLRRLLLWTGVCSVSAAPSFFWASQEYDQAAMITGVGCFILMLTAASCTQRFERFKARRFVRRTLYIGYGLRVILSLALPIGMAIDMLPGLISISLVESLGLRGSDFTGTLLITLVQGGILNILVTVFMAIVYGVQRLFGGRPVPEYACTRCRYDLRGNPDGDVCPECGTPKPEPPIHVYVCAECGY